MDALYLVNAEGVKMDRGDQRWAVLYQMGRGLNVSQAAKAVGIPPLTVFRWLRKPSYRATVEKVLREKGLEYPRRGGNRRKKRPKAAKSFDDQPMIGVFTLEASQDVKETSRYFRELEQQEKGVEKENGST